MDCSVCGGSKAHLAPLSFRSGISVLRPGVHEVYPAVRPDVQDEETPPPRPGE